MTTSRSVTITILLTLAALVGCGGGGPSSGEDGSLDSIQNLDLFEETPPASVIPDPDLCANPTDHLIDLGELDPKALGHGTFAVEVTNENGQEFTLTFSGRGDQLVGDYIDGTRLCIEAVPAGPPGAPYHPPASIPNMIIDQLAAGCDCTRAQLAAYRDDQVASGTAATLADIGQHFDANLENVKQAAHAQIADSFSEVDTTAIDETIEDILAQPYAPFLVAQRELPADDDQYARLSATRNVVVIEVGVDDANLEDESSIAIIYYFDPAIHLNKFPSTIYYHEKCDQDGASARLHAKSGIMMLHFWQGTKSNELDSRLGDADSDYLRDPRRVADIANSGEARQYGVWVKGLKNNSGYQLSGSWTLGKQFC